jgi:hypothetical protein
MREPALAAVMASADEATASMRRFAVAGQPGRRHRRAPGGSAIRQRAAPSRRARAHGARIGRPALDAADLIACGAPVGGEPGGRGYVLRPGYLLPPPTLAAAGRHALVLGARLVPASADRALASAADDAQVKLEAVGAADDLVGARTRSA